MNDILPRCYKKETKPHLFCAGCGHGIILKQLGFLIDEMAIQDQITLGIDIGCSLLAWDFYDFDTVQTHHGRTVPVMVGYKMVQPKRIALAYMGDGGAYAIGLQSLLHAAHRNNPITVIVVNNANYGMTGGQMSPTTLVDMVSTTTPSGKKERYGTGIKGPELIRSVAAKEAFIARATVNNPVQLKMLLKKSIEHQSNCQSFSMLEVLSTCPNNWKTDAKETLSFVKSLESDYPIGEIQ